MTKKRKDRHDAPVGDDLEPAAEPDLEPAAEPDLEPAAEPDLEPAVSLLVELLTHVDDIVVTAPLIMAAVTGQVIDTTANPWGFATLQFSLLLPSGQKPVDLTTGLVIPNPPPIICDINGNFATNLQTNAMIVPASLWQLMVYPFNNQKNGQVLEPFAVTGAMNLTATIAANLQPYLDPPLILPMSNSTTTGQSELNGSVYYDVEEGALMVRDPSTQAYKNVQFTNEFVTGKPSIASDGINIILNPATTGGVFLCHDSGLGTTFGNAAGNPLGIGQIDTLGNLRLDGDITANSSTAYVDNAATPGPCVFKTGVGILVSGVLRVNFAKPFGSGNVYILITVISANAPGTAPPTIWIFSATPTSFEVHASSASSNDAFSWLAFGHP